MIRPALAKQAGNKTATRFEKKSIITIFMEFERSEASNKIVRKHLDALQPLEQSQNFHIYRGQEKNYHR